MTSGDTPATPDAKKKKQPVAGAAVENRPVAKTKEVSGPPSDVQPGIESTLVGAATGATKAATKRADVKPEVGKAALAKDVGAVPSVPRTGSKTDTKPAETTPFATSTSARATDTKAADTTPAATEQTSAKPTQRPAEPRKSGFFPTVLGGVIAAGLGAGATYWAIPHLPVSLRPDMGAAVSTDAQLDASRTAATEAARAEVQAQTDTLISRATDAGADAARQVIANAAPDDPQNGTPAALPVEITDKLSGLEKTVADLTARLSQPAEAAPGGVSQAALDDLTARLSQQQARIEELAARPAVDPATAEQVEALATQAQELQKSTEAANRRAQAATAASVLQAAIDSGAAREQPLADLAAAGVEVPAVLSGDIPRLDQLRAEFAPAARAGLRASGNAQSANEGAMGKIGNFFRVQTGARSVEPREGNDPDAVLSRADAAVEAGDIRGAMSQIGALPQPGQDAMSTWTARAQVWVDANAALAALAQASR